MRYFKHIDFVIAEIITEKILKLLQLLQIFD